MRYRIIFCLGWLAGMGIFIPVIWADSVTVQFRDFAHVRLQNGSWSGRAFPGELRELNRFVRSKGFLIEPTFHRKSPWQYDQERHSSFNSFYEIHMDDSSDAEDLAKTLRSYQVIESVTSEEKTVLLSLDDQAKKDQYYLNSMPSGDPEIFGGVDAQYAWTIPGGTGKGITIVDYELGWELTHEDLPQGIELLFGSNSSYEGYRHHGTRTLGILGGLENELGVTGIAYESTLKVASNGFGMKNGPSLEAIVEQMVAGDILVLELGSQGCPSGLAPDACTHGIPLETIPAVFSVLQAATDQGIIVVESAGNSGLDLDQPSFNWQQNGKDSGAIIVGAGLHGSLAPQSYTNYGTRVDVQGFGDGVVTTDLNNSYTQSYSDPLACDTQEPTSFCDTSSATAIVAGVVASLQGVAKAKGEILSAEQLRDILKKTGSPQQESDKLIGPLPNLKNAIAALPEPPLASQENPPEAPPPPDQKTIDFLKSLRQCLSTHGWNKPCFFQPDRDISRWQKVDTLPAKKPWY